MAAAASSGETCNPPGGEDKKNSKIKKVLSFLWITDIVAFHWNGFVVGIALAPNNNYTSNSLFFETI
eukprot:scaffold5699_cov96-Cylindrotheca_fusiformis.AAC.1